MRKRPSPSSPIRFTTILSGEEEKEPHLWQALGEQDFRANKFDDLLRCQEEKWEALEAHVTQQAAELERLSTEVAHGRWVHRGGFVGDYNE